MPRINLLEYLQIQNLQEFEICQIHVNRFNISVYTRVDILNLKMYDNIFSSVVLIALFFLVAVKDWELFNFECHYFPLIMPPNLL